MYLYMDKLMEAMKNILFIALAATLALTGCKNTTNQNAQNMNLNEVIGRNLDVTIEYMSREQAADLVDLSKLPEDASETLRIVRVGDYDACACIGAHVKNTAEIGTFKILSHDYEDGRWRVRWKVIE